MRIPLLIALAVALAGCGGDGEAPEVTPPTQAEPPVAPADTTAGGGAPGAVTVEIEEREGSGLSGRAQLTPEEGATTIVVELDDETALPAGVYLQEGDCTAVSAEAAEVLALFLDGRSETVVDAELAQLLNGRFAITVYAEESEDLQQPDACGEITREGA